jgi:hypothetical protein
MAEAKGCQHHVSLAQEILDLLRLNRPRHLELLHYHVHCGKLAELFFCELFLLVNWLPFPGSQGSGTMLQGAFLERDGEIVVVEVLTRLPQAPPLRLNGGLVNTEVIST